MKIIFCLFIMIISINSSANFLKQVQSYIENDPSYLEVKNLSDYNQLLELSAKSKLFLPDLTLSHTRAADQSIGTNNEVSSGLTSLNLNYSLFSAGSDYANFRSNKYSLVAFKENLNQSLMDKEKIIMTYLLGHIRLLKNLEIQKEIISLKEKSYSISKRKFKRGTLSKNDLIKIKIDLSNTKSALISIKKELFQIKDTLEAYGLKIQQTKFPWTPLFAKHGIKKALNLDFDKDKIPKLANFKFQMKSQQAYAKSQSAKHYGAINIKYSRQLYQVNNEDDVYGHSASIVYTLPLFEHFDQQKLVKQARANASTAQSRFNYNKNLALSNWKSKRELLKLHFSNYQERMISARDSLELFDNMIKRFKKGVLSVNELFTEQDRLLLTKRLTNQSIYDLHISYIDLAHSNGSSLINHPNLTKI